MVSFSIPLLGGTVEFVIHDATPEAVEMLKPGVIAEAKRLQGIFNLYDEHSELSQLNAARSLRVSAELREVIIQAIERCEATDGQYDITFGRNFLERKQGRPLSALQCTYRDVRIDGDTITLTHPDALLDLGSIAKGYIADRLAAFLKEQGVLSGLVDARGDIVAFGDHIERIDVQHPRDPEAIIASCVLHDEAVATSGDYRQFIGSFAKSHILNSKDLISVTVVAQRLADADALASAIFVADPKQREALIHDAVSQHVRLLTVDSDCTIHRYNWQEQGGAA